MLLVAISRLDLGRRSQRRAAIGFQNGFVSIERGSILRQAVVGFGSDHTSFERAPNNK